MKYKPDHVLIRARNGAVIAYDETGLILRLSDEVLADIETRLAARRAPLRGLDDIDGWNLRAEGDWLRFDACLPPFSHTRAYRRRAGGGAVIADAQGPLLAVLTVGGVAASLGFDGPAHFPHHVVTPGDDLGPSGACGTERVCLTDQLHTAGETTRTSLLADAILARRHAGGLPLSLIAARSETDGSPTVSELATGRGLENLDTVLDGLQAAAGTLGEALKVVAVTIDYGAEDVTTPVDAFVQGIRAVVDRVLEACARRGLARPVVFLRCDGGPEGPARQWQLAAGPAGQPTAITAPGYALPRTRQGRLTREGAALQAALDAEMLAARAEGLPWTCPLPILAERAGSDRVHVTFLAQEPLELAEAPPVGTAQHCGFALTGPDAPAIRAVQIHPQDPRMVVLTLSGPATGIVSVDYAVGGPGAVRDLWRGTAPGSAVPLCRWALPARLGLH